MPLAIWGRKIMDYYNLAEEFLRNMQAIRNADTGKGIQEGPRGEAFALFYIKEMSGKIVPSDICGAAGVSSARVAVILNNLEGKGFITRRIDSDDRRKIIVELTPEGAEYAEEEQKRHMEKLIDTLMLLGEEDAKELVRITGKLAVML